MARAAVVLREQSVMANQTKDDKGCENRSKRPEPEPEPPKSDWWDWPGLRLDGDAHCRRQFRINNGPAEDLAILERLVEAGFVVRWTERTYVAPVYPLKLFVIGLS